MDKQQDKQNNLKKLFKEISSLDSLTEYILNAVAEKIPSYFHEYEKELAKSIRDYGIGIVQECLNRADVSNETIKEIAENRISDALDASCLLNHKYFETGIQFGALMMVQLLF